MEGRVFFSLQNEELLEEIPEDILLGLKQTKDPSLATVVVTDRVTGNVFRAHDSVEEVIFVGCDQEKLNVLIEKEKGMFPWITSRTIKPG